MSTTMRRSTTSLWFALLMSAGCSEESGPIHVEQSRSRGQVVSDDVQRDDAKLKFTITAVHRNRSPLNEAPFHQPGGDWTYLECQAGSNPTAKFIVGVAAQQHDRGEPAAFGRAFLAVNSRSEGANLVEVIARSFRTQPPKISERNYSPVPLRIPSIMHGQGLEQDNESQPGEWITTQWFPESEGKAAELFFSFNLAHRVGEFREKDFGHAQNLLAIFASALRDGPRSERTPENDSNLARLGPRVGPGRQILDRNGTGGVFSPGGKYLVYEDANALFALEVGVADSKPFELARFEHSPRYVRVANEDLELLVGEVLQQNARRGTSEDRIWWVGPRGGQKQLICGPEWGLLLQDAAISPDLRYVAFDRWRGKTDDELTQSLLTYDRHNGKTMQFQDLKEVFTVIGWRDTPAGLRAVTITNPTKAPGHEISDLYLADPAFGTFELQDVEDPRFERENVLSHDGKHRVRVDAESLTVTDVASGVQRRFDFHEDDLAYVNPQSIEWASPRYLKFDGLRPALIDVTTMKMSYPGPAPVPGGRSTYYRFSPDLRWAVYPGDEESPGIYLAPVELPKEE